MFEISTKSEVILSILRVLIFVFIVSTVATPEFVLLGFVFSYFVALLVTFILVALRIGTPTTGYEWSDVFEEYQLFASYQIIHSLVKTASAPALVWILTAFIGPVAVAGWNVIFQFHRLMTRAVNPIRRVFFPRFSEKKGDQVAVTEMAHKHVKFCLLFTIPAAVGGTILAEDIIIVLFSAKYTSVERPLRILLWIAPFSAIGTAPYFVGQGRTKDNLKISLVRRGLIILSFAVGAMTYGLTGAVFGYGFGVVTATILMFYIIIRESDRFSIEELKIIRLSVSMVVMATVIFSLQGYVDGIVSLILVIATGGATYTVFLLRFRMLTEEEKKWILKAVPSGWVRRLADRLISV